MSPEIHPDPEIEVVSSAILANDPDGKQMAEVLRDTLDQLYDGQRTGRYRWDQLSKTEKTHCGTLVEINLQRKFRFDYGDTLDYRIAGIEVDCKYSQTLYGWMIPPEAVNHICLLMWADDVFSQWSAGLVRATNDLLNTGSNRDSKSSLASRGRDVIRWLFEKSPLPPNILLQLDRSEVERIFNLDSGQKRVTEIFRIAPNRAIGRAAIAALARQVDYMKRIRGNGGARSALQKEGYIILGQYGAHIAIAQSLGMTVPGKGESVSVRVVPAKATDENVAKIDGGLWRIASVSDPVVNAPALPGV